MECTTARRRENPSAGSVAAREQRAQRRAMQHGARDEPAHFDGARGAVRRARGRTRHAGARGALGTRGGLGSRGGGTMRHEDSEAENVDRTRNVRIRAAQRDRHAMNRTIGGTSRA